MCMLKVTPYSVSDQWGQLDWLRVLSLWEDLPVSMKRVGELVGVEERFLVGAVRGTLNMKNNGQVSELEQLILDVFVYDWIFQIDCVRFLFIF